jgi:membrane protease YdiL (CAAX protease family)
MPSAKQRARRLLLLTLLFEGGLGAVALLLGWIVGHSPLTGLAAERFGAWEQGAAILWGALAALPLVAGLLLAERAPGAGWTRLRDLVTHRLVPLFRQMSVVQFALISLAAGWGEELLFRGLLQAGLAERLQFPGGDWLALLTASVLFGLCHWLTHTYALLATLVGLYLGILLMATDQILVPITAHALYDFLALVYLVHWPARSDERAGERADEERADEEQAGEEQTGE